MFQKNINNLTQKRKKLSTINNEEKLQQEINAAIQRRKNFNNSMNELRRNPQTNLPPLSEKMTNYKDDPYVVERRAELQAKIDASKKKDVMNKLKVAKTGINFTKAIRESKGLTRENKEDALKSIVDKIFTAKPVKNKFKTDIGGKNGLNATQKEMLKKEKIDINRDFPEFSGTTLPGLSQKKTNLRRPGTNPAANISAAGARGGRVKSLLAVRNSREGQPSAQPTMKSNLTPHVLNEILKYKGTSQGILNIAEDKQYFSKLTALSITRESIPGIRQRLLGIMTRLKKIKGRDEDVTKIETSLKIIPKITEQNLLV